MTARPAFVVHTLDHGRAALAAAADVPVRLLSPSGAALYQGIGWWLTLIGMLRAEFPRSAFVAALDCADAPGLALTALRQGAECVILRGEGAAWRAVKEVAEQKGAWGEGRWGNDALDLLGALDPGRSCREHVERTREHVR